MKYKRASDFRKALGDRLKSQAEVEGIDIDSLRKRLSFERLLARLFRTGSERWVLKGGYALDLRSPGRTRSTRDLDLNVPSPAGENLLDALQEAAETDLGDFFELIIQPSRTALKGPPLGGVRFTVELRLDGRPFNRFPLDVGYGDIMVRPPDLLMGQVDLAFADLPRPSITVYPIEDHFAEKLHAYTRPRENPSRVKDLVDLALLLEIGLEASRLLLVSIRETFERYTTHTLPDELPVPPNSWQGPFMAMAQEVDLAIEEISAAHARINAFLVEVRSFG